MEKYLKHVTKESHKKIMDYLDNSIYKIKLNEEKYGIGFFCNIKFQNKVIPLLITNYRTINEEYYSNHKNIKVLINNSLISVKFGSISYINKYSDLSIIEIKENKLIKILDVDDIVYKEESEINLYKESIYIIHYNNNDICVSYGVIENKNNSDLIILSNIQSDLNYYPIFNLSSNKLIGIYQKNSSYYIKGKFFKYIIDIIDEINNENNKIKENYNEIKIRVKINKADIGKKIYFFHKEYKEDYLKYSSDVNLKELNVLNTEMYINQKKRKI